VTQQDLLERSSKVSVEPRVDDRIEKTVCESKPEKETVEPVRDARLWVGAEGFDERQDEKGKPAGSERAHDDSQRLCRFSIVG